MEKQRYRGYLDALKGIAIIGVTLIHSGAGSLPGIFGLIGRNGNCGVQMFFVISGMLNISSADHFFHSPENVNHKTVLRWYYKKLVRLIPLYYIALAASVLTQSWSTYWLGTERYVTGWNLIAHIFLVHGFFPHYIDSVLCVEWYLGILVIYIAITPLIYRYANSIERMLVLLLAIYIVNPYVNALLARILPMESDPVVYRAYSVYFGPFTQIFVYTTGVFLFYVIKVFRFPDKTSKKAFSRVTVIFAAALIYGLFKGDGGLYRLSAQELYGILFAIIILSQEVYSIRIIDNCLFRTIGKYSYGMYLFQFVWLNIYNRHIHIAGTLGCAVRILCAIVGLFGLSFLLTHIIDAPLQKRLNRILR